MKATKLRHLGQWIGIIVGAALLLGFCFLSVQYYRWREGLLPDAYHQDAPLGKFSLGGTHFGACLTDAQNGGYATYGDGLPTVPFVHGPGHSEVWIGRRSGNAITLQIVRGARDTVVIFPLP